MQHNQILPINIAEKLYFHCNLFVMRNIFCVLVLWAKCSADMWCVWVKRGAQSPSSSDTSSSHDWGVRCLHSRWLPLHFISHKVNKPLIPPLSKAFCFSIICVHFFFLSLVLLNDPLNAHLWPLQCTRWLLHIFYEVDSKKCLSTGEWF